MRGKTDLIDIYFNSFINLYQLAVWENYLIKIAIILNAWIAALLKTKKVQIWSLI